MAIFRKIHTTFWSDSFISELDADKKLFYIYLLTNERTRQCGIYEITKRQISFDTGYSIDTVSILLQYFIDTEKILYNNSTNEIAIKNWRKYNPDNSPKVKSCVNKELSDVKDTVLIQYIYSIDTQSQQEQEQEQEQEEEQEREKKFSLHDFKNDFEKDLSEITLILSTDQIWYEIICMNHKIGLSDFNKWLLKFISTIRADGVEKKSVNDAKQHFNRWLGYELVKESKNNKAQSYTTEQLRDLEGYNKTRRQMKLAEKTMEEYLTSKQ